jgi:hypothetical protein
VNDFSSQTVRFIGISELLGAIGIVAPQFQERTSLILFNFIELLLSGICFIF